MQEVGVTSSHVACARGVRFSCACEAETMSAAASWLTEHVFLCSDRMAAVGDAGAPADVCVVLHIACIECILILLCNLRNLPQQGLDLFQHAPCQQYQPQIFLLDKLSLACDKVFHTG